jgi:DNA repair exonuclease SbcCD ATPase subunit
LAQKEDLKIQFSKIRDDIAEIKDSVDRLNRKRHEMDQANAEIKPLKESRDQLVYSIKRAEEYDAELQDYQGRYNTIETLKKYSSPTSGIQTIYMNLYMNKTLEMANDLLKYLFNGYLELLPYVINEDEFRIPVKHGNGMISDDISSCSTAQICMISMVVTISLSLQSSGIFNIFRFDEIDGGLDTDNRLYFFDTLKRMCSELGIQQMIVISHSIESNMNGVDVIKLATPSNIEYDLSGVNVIYDYNRRWR